MTDQGRPTVIVPYAGPAEDPADQDVFVYLRPETNGVLVESTIMQVIRACSEESYRPLKLLYLANIPGEYIVSHHVVERYYQLKLHFAVHGPRAFTPPMKRVFEERYGLPFAEANVVGAFEAIREMKISPDDLFRMWVPGKDVLLVAGQCIKRLGDRYVVNYDMPALLHKNNSGTDIAAMAFRTSAGYDFLNDVTERIREALVQSEVLSPRAHSSRAFHFSKGPFEALNDGLGYLTFADGREPRLSDLTFTTHLNAAGWTDDMIAGLLRQPLVAIEDRRGRLREESLFVYTMFDSYHDAIRKVDRIRAQRLILDPDDGWITGPSS